MRERGGERGAAPVHSHEPTGQTKCLLADKCEKSECPLTAESSEPQNAPTVLRRPLTSHFAVRDGFPSDLGYEFFFSLGGGVKSVCRPLVCCVINTSTSVTDFFWGGAKAKAGMAGHSRVPEIN